MHVTKAYLPLDVAKALAVNPLLVQKAVETFYTRDALQLRVRIARVKVEEMLYPDVVFCLGRTEDGAVFPSTGRPDLCQDDSHSICATGWSEVPPSQSLRSVDRARRDEGMEMERRWHEDCKLMVPRRDLPALLTRACTQACGFEMLYQESKNRKETLSASFDGSPASVRAMTQP